MDELVESRRCPAGHAGMEQLGLVDGLGHDRSSGAAQILRPPPEVSRAVACGGNPTVVRVPAEAKNQCAGPFGAVYDAYIERPWLA